jgi:MFS family permease
MPGPDEVSRPRMLTRPLVLVFVSSFGFSTSFYLVLSVVPLYATSVGAGGAGAGFATGALMLSTVAAELVTPLLVSRFGYRAVFAAGFVLLGAPTFALGAVPTTPGTSSPPSRGGVQQFARLRLLHPHARPRGARGRLWVQRPAAAGLILGLFLASLNQTVVGTR